MDKPRLQVTNLTVLCQQRALLSVPDLKVFPGEVVAILGPSGEGKSTLFNVLAGLSTQYTGHIVWDSANWQGWDKTTLRQWRYRHLAYVPQQGVLLSNLTVAQYLRYMIIQNNLDETHQFNAMQPIIQRWGMQSCLKQRIQTLSGGQQQRLSLLSLYCRHGEVWLLDEPTAALDKENARLVIQDLKSDAKEKHIAMLLTTHDDRILSEMDKVFKIKNGVLVCE